MSALFAYQPALTARFPALHAGVIHAGGLLNRPSTPGLVAEYRHEQQVVLQRLAQTPIAAHPSIGAWRRAFTALGVKPTQYRVAAEALLRRLHKAEQLPLINTLVDIGNLVSIRYALPVAVFDLAGVDGSTTVRPAAGDERFTDLGSTDPVSPEPGEVVFVDDAGVVSARRWCWRQSAQSATGARTTEALITIEGLHDDAAADVAAATRDLAALLTAHQSGHTSRCWQLSAAAPSLDTAPELER